MFRCIILCLLLTTACVRTERSITYKDVLRENPELQTVLDYCKDDSQKYQAAIFLIENLPYHYSYEGEALNNYKRLFELHGQGELSPEMVLDSIQRAYGPIRLETLKAVSDINIDPSYLIDNIDWAFKVWREQPWGENVSFEDFCEYILPHRVANESPEPWREWIYNKYNPLLDSIRHLPEAKNPKYASQYLLNILHALPDYYTSLFPSGPCYGPQVVEWRSGTCADFTYLQLYVFRAVGLPCSEEFMPIQGQRNAAHFWNAAFDKDGNAYRCSVVEPTSNLIPTETAWVPKGKVYRRTFSVNREMIEAMGAKADNRYPSFRYPRIQDVTASYAGDRNQTFSITPDSFYNHVKQNEPVYLCAASWMRWEPVGWSLFDKKQGVTFKDVEGAMVFRLATYEKGNILLQSDPFLLDMETGEISFFSSETPSHEISLTSKYEDNMEPFNIRMVNGVFEASNLPDFSDTDTLFIIKQQPGRLWNVAHSISRRPYRYVRYKGAVNSYCDVAEISFYGNYADTDPLQGRPIGTPSNRSDGSNEYTYAVDGDPYTSFSYINPDGGWIGLDLGKPQKISKIIFTPRNRDNYIRTDDEYELFYCEKDKWISAGRKKPASDSLLYTVPEGALLYLKDHTRGVDERIFEYKNGKQIFW